jgi:hypothetical protein
MGGPFSLIARAPASSRALSWPALSGAALALLPRHFDAVRGVCFQPSIGYCTFAQM